MPAFARDVLKVGQARYGVLLGANGVGALLGALTVATIGSHVNRRVLVLGGLWFFSAMLLLLAWVSNYYVALVVLALVAGECCCFSPQPIHCSRPGASDEMRGRLWGIWTLVFGGTTPLAAWSGHGFTLSRSSLGRNHRRPDLCGGRARGVANRPTGPTQEPQASELILICRLSFNCRKFTRLTTLVR
jgi:MFS family permease